MTEILQAMTTNLWPTSLVGVFGMLVAIISFIVGAYKAIVYWADKNAETEQKKNDNTLELEKSKLQKDIELAKHNQFTAESVKDIFSEIIAITKEVDKFKYSSAIKDEHMMAAISSLEKLLEELSKNLNMLLTKAISHEK